MKEGSDRDYEVGYGKPPRHTRFKKGHSGNPKGRPRGSKKAGAILKRALLTQVAARENGRSSTISKLEAMIVQAVNKAAGGDFRAFEFLLTKIPWLTRDLAEPRPDKVARREAVEQAMELVRGIL